MTRPGRAYLTVGIAAALATTLGAYLTVENAGAAAGSDAVVRDEQPARAPFASLTAGTVRVGRRTLDVVVADSLDERVQGLRGRPDATPYDGMLFVFPAETTVAFTMAGVPDPLDIAFFDRRGRRVDRLRMKPCAGTDATCPVYAPDGPFRYALETAPGALPDGRLRVRTG